MRPLRIWGSEAGAWRAKAHEERPAVEDKANEVQSNHVARAAAEYGTRLAE
jgi:hypothetical protein